VKIEIAEVKHMRVVCPAPKSKI